MRFEQKATGYTRAAVVQAELADWVAEWIGPGWPAAERVWEFGAGTGLLTRHLARRGSLIATDISARMLHEGKRRLPEVRWELADAWNPPRGPVDRLFSSALLQWAAEPRRVLDAWLHLLTPGGRMLHGLFVSPSLPEFAEIAGDAIPLRWRSGEDWVAAAAQAGFDVCRWETRTVRQRHASAREFLRQLHDSGATAATPRLRVGQLRSKIAELDHRHAGSDGRVDVTWTLLRFEGRRPRR